MSLQKESVDNVDKIFDKNGSYTPYILSKNREILYFVLIGGDRFIFYQHSYPQIQYL